MAEMMRMCRCSVWWRNFELPEVSDCGKEIKLFGESHIDDVAKELGIGIRKASA